MGQLPGQQTQARHRQHGNEAADDLAAPGALRRKCFTGDDRRPIHGFSLVKIITTYRLTLAWGYRSDYFGPNTWDNKHS
jgi:hypothetical protein